MLLTWGNPLGALASKVSASKGEAAAAKFTTTHRHTLEKLEVASCLTRTTDTFSSLQLNQLELVSKSFGEAFRLSSPNQRLKVKGHLVEQHVAAFTQNY